MKHVLKTIIILFFQALLFLFSVNVFADTGQKQEVKDPYIRVSDDEVARYKGLIPGYISSIDVKSGIITLIQEHEGKTFAIDVPIQTITKNYIVKRWMRIQSLLTKNSSGYDKGMYIITDEEQIKKALSFRRYASVPEDPEKAATFEKVAAIAIKDAEKSD